MYTLLGLNSFLFAPAAVVYGCRLSRSFLCGGRRPRASKVRLQKNRSEFASLPTALQGRVTLIRVLVLTYWKTLAKKTHFLCC